MSRDVSCYIYCFGLVDFFGQFIPIYIRSTRNNISNNVPFKERNLHANLAKIVGINTTKMKIR